MTRGKSLKPLLSLAFFLSGCSGLIYQTVWVRMLTRYLGATTHATATVLIVFMTGLSLGSLLAGRFADRAKRPLFGYALIELAIGLTGLLASLAVIHGLGQYYVQVHHWLGDQPAALLAARVLFVVPCLLVPTVLMGATLPLMVAFVTRLGQHLQSGLGQLYGINTCGAVVGVLAAGFVLLGEFGETNSLYIAAGLNAAAALGAISLWPLQNRTPVYVSPAAGPDGEPITPYPAPLRGLAFVTLFISGLTALAYEILWTRLLVLILKTSIYAFSTMLATFLMGIAMGSDFAARNERTRRSPLLAVAVLELLIGLWTVVGMVLVPRFFQLEAEQERIRMQLVVDLLACLAIVFPIAFCFGAQFPTAVRCCLSLAAAPGRATGRAYTVNTLGTIVGSVAAGFFLIPLLGTAKTMIVLASVNVILGCVLFFAAPRAERSRLAMPVAAVLVLLFANLLPLAGDPYRRVMTQHVGGLWDGGGRLFGYFEGAEATTIPAGDDSHPMKRVLFVNGTNMTLLCTETKLMAHLPYLLADQPKRMLVICGGMGTTMRSASSYPDLQIDVVDIVPEVFKCFGYFHKDIDRVLAHPAGLRLHGNDGRNYLLTHPDRYDVITVDPAPPLHSAGTVNLYTREFFELCKSRLTPGGAFCMWVPPAPAPEILMIMKAFNASFPEGSLWGGLDYDGFYLVGGHRSYKQTPAQVDALADQLSRIKELGEWGRSYSDKDKVRRMYLTDGAGLARLVESVPMLTDDRPYTEFPMWRQLFAKDGHDNFRADDVRAWLRQADQAQRASNR
jgi:spermidine synthase